LTEKNSQEMERSYIQTDVDILNEI